MRNGGLTFLGTKPAPLSMLLLEQACAHPRPDSMHFLTYMFSSPKMQDIHSSLFEQPYHWEYSQMVSFAADKLVCVKTPFGGGFDFY